MPQTLGVYDVYGTLGKGTFSRIRFAVNRETGLSFAIKMYDKSKLRDNGMLESTRNEIAVMKSLDHKNCIGIRDMFASKEKIYLVLDLVMGGSLRQKLSKRERFSESRSRYYFNVLLGVLEYCHSMNVVVGGLTLEGILVDSDGILKVSDFSCACLLPSSNESVSDSATDSNAARSSAAPATASTHSSAANTVASFYMAPEMVEHNIRANTATDVWSLGIVLYAMMAGYMPFDLNPTLPEMLRNIRIANYSPFPDWFTQELMDVLLLILVADPSHRATIAMLKEETWLQWQEYYNLVYNNNNDAEFNEGGNGGGSGNPREYLSEDEFTDNDDDDVKEHNKPGGVNMNNGSSSYEFMGDERFLCANAFKSLPVVGITELLMAPIRLFQSAAGVDSSAKAKKKAERTNSGSSNSNGNSNRSNSKRKEEQLLQQYVQEESEKTAAAAAAAEASDEEDGDV